MEKKLILATTSIPRKQAFDELQIPYESLDSNIEEKFIGRPRTPKALVLILSKLKAESIAKERPNSIVVGFDSVAYFNKQILEKPKSKQEVYKRLKSFSDGFYDFYTGIHLIDGDFFEPKVVRTRAHVRNLNENEIKKYLDQDSNFKRYAQGFDPLNTFGASFIKRIEGSYNNILRGIPLEEIVDMIKRRGFEIK